MIAIKSQKVHFRRGKRQGTQSLCRCFYRKVQTIRLVYPWRPIEITASSVRLPSMSQNFWKSGPSR
jgi:hypothetical protein